MGGTSDGSGGRHENGKQHASGTSERNAREGVAIKKSQNDVVSYFADRKAVELELPDRTAANENLAAAAKLHLAAVEQASKR